MSRILAGKRPFVLWQLYSVLTLLCLPLHGQLTEADHKASLLPLLILASGLYSHNFDPLFADAPVLPVGHYLGSSLSISDLLYSCPLINNRGSSASGIGHPCYESFDNSYEAGYSSCPDRISSPGGGGGSPQGNGQDNGDEDENDGICAICQHPLSEGKVCSLPCGHRLHEKCLRRLKNSSPDSVSCPLCRAGICWDELTFTPGIKRPYRCQHCRGSFSTKHAVSDHLQAGHQFCYSCVRLIGRRNWRRHCRSMHTDSASCAQCNTGFRFPANLADHVNQQHRMDVWQTDCICMFFEEDDEMDDIIQHLLDHHTFAYCMVCTAVVAGSASILEHHDAHQLYQCTFCQHRFASQEALETHQIQHHLGRRQQ